MELMGVFDQALVEPLAQSYGKAWRDKMEWSFSDRINWMRFL